jgi:uncharacterized protein YaeQ
MWWNANAKLLAKNKNLQVNIVNYDTSKALAKMAERALNLQCTIQEGSVWLDDGVERVAVETIRVYPT